ncbi:MAG: ABC transporter permease [Candidatus Aminicenantes bacterium]|nr:ABC transporter permease [Candidatus Aminicenantes bacterium]
MIRNYFVTAMRNIARHKVFSLFNIAGLAVGLAIFILAAQYGAFRRSFDAFHGKAARTFLTVGVNRTGNAGRQNSSILPAALTAEMKSVFPEVEEAVRIIRSRVVLKNGDRKFNESHFFYVDPAFLRTFDFAMVRGRPETALAGTSSIVLTESSARKYFGGEDPVGKVLTLNGTLDLVVSGVAKEPPLATSLHFDFLAPFETARALDGRIDDRFAASTDAFVVLTEGAAPAQLETEFPAFLKRYYMDAPDAPERLFLLPLRSFHNRAEPLKLITRLDWGRPYSIVTYFYLIAAAALLMVCINFMNLAAAWQAVRAREVGLRKVVGASRAELVRQFLGESVTTAFIALPAAVLLFYLIEPAFIAYMGFDMDLSIASYPTVVPVLLAVTLAVGLLAGSYPALVLSSFRPAVVLKGARLGKAKGSLPRKIMIVSQFALSIILLVLTGATRNQLNYLGRMDFGLSRSDVISVPLPVQARDDLPVLKDRLLEDPRVTAVSASLILLGNHPGLALDVIPEGTHGTDRWAMRGFAVDYGFIEMLGIRTTRGRSFSRDYDDESSLVINETAAKELGWEDPLGRRLTVRGKVGTIVGIVNDFLYNDVHFKCEPTVLYRDPGEFAQLLVKTRAGAADDASLLAAIEDRWNAVAPDLPFEPVTLDDVFKDHYKYIDQMSTVFGLVAGFALLVASMGLLGMASYAVGRRAKEIGIRKTLGATDNTVFKMLLSEFLRLIALSNVIALPVAFFLIRSFLRWAWSYRVETGPGLFAFVSALTLAISFGAIAYHTLKAARTNPVEALRHE